MIKWKYIEVPEYKRGIWIFIGNHNAFKDWITDYFKNDIEYHNLIDYVKEQPEVNPSGTFWHNEATGDGIIEIAKFPSTPREIAALCHECLHAVFIMLDFLGINYDKNSHGENHCYLDEYFIANILTPYDYKTF